MKDTRNIYIYIMNILQKIQNCYYFEKNQSISPQQPQSLYDDHNKSNNNLIFLAQNK